MRPRFEAYMAALPQDLEMQMEAVIDYAFSGGGQFARYEDWSHDEFYSAFARATWVLEHAQGVKLAPATEEQQKPKKPKGGKTPIEELPFTEFGGERMALRNINEVATKAARAQRLMAIRKATAGKT